MADIFDLFKQIGSKNPEPTTPPEWIIAGLGNPGDKYFHTRHNTGFLSMDYLSQKYGAKINRSRFKALVGQAEIAGKQVLLMKPQTMMNLSGDAIAEAAAFYKIPAERILIIYDDISLDVGRLRVRAKGSDGGHNGIKSIILRLNSDTFPRIKVGVGQKPCPEYDLAAWVLGEFPDADKKTLFEVFPMVCRGAELILTNKIDAAMGECNGFNSAVKKEN